MAIALLLWVSMNAPAAAQEDLSFVYGTNHFDGATYSSAMVPPEIETVYLLADHTSMVAPRFTRIYYWPLTNELKADWDAANIRVEGTVEILQNNRVIETVAPTIYVIQYDGLDKMGTTELYLGDEAVAVRQKYETLREQYREDLFRYFEELNQYREMFQAALAELQAGNITEDELPTPPAPREDMTLFSTELLWGNPIELPVGRYTFRLRLPDGSIQPDSEKQLVVFEAIQDGIGYNVFPAERWTVPELSSESNETIYTLPQKTIYLEPFYQKLYNEQYYTRMNNPQDRQARRDREVWIPFSKATDVQLLVSAGSDSARIDLQDYFVRQLAGDALGYEILEFDPQSMQSPSFNAFELTVNANEVRLALLDQNEQVMPRSDRKIKVLQIDRTWLIYLLSAIPLLLGVVIIYLRRKSVEGVAVFGQG